MLMDHMFDKTLDYLDQVDRSEGLMTHHNQIPIRQKGSNLKWNGFNLGFKLQDRFGT